MYLFILGAGFTKAFCSNAPVLNTLLDEIDDVKTKKKVTEYQMKYNIKDNEILLSMLLDDSYSFNFNEKIERMLLSNNILTGIGKLIRGIKVDQNNSKLFKDIIENTLSCQFNKYNKQIVSFNWDAILEDQNIVQVDPLISIGHNPYGKKNLEGGVIGPQINILKLHGSIKWFKISENEPADLSNVFAVEHDHRSLNLIIDKQAPVIVPFGYSKGKFMEGNLFTVLWNKFDHLLSECEHIIIMGYSFPSSDYQILMKLFNYKGKIKKVVIKEESDSEILKRLKTLFPENVIVNKDLKEINSNDLLI